MRHSSTSEYYGITDLNEAKAFLNDEYLGGHLIEISDALLQLNCDDARLVMGSLDDIKLKSSMTLFAAANSEKVFFSKVLDKFFGGKKDYHSLKKLGLQEVEKE